MLLLRSGDARKQQPGLRGPNGDGAAVACLGSAVGDAAFEERGNLVRVYWISQALAQHLFEIRVSGRQELLGGIGDVVRGPAQDNLGSEQCPIGARAAFVWQTHTSSVNEAMTACSTVELAVGVTTHHELFRNLLEDPSETLIRRRGRDDLAVATRRAVTEDNLPKALDLKPHGGTKIG